MSLSILKIKVQPLFSKCCTIVVIALFKLVLLIVTKPWSFDWGPMLILVKISVFRDSPSTSWAVMTKGFWWAQTISRASAMDWTLDLLIFFYSTEHRYLRIHMLDLFKCWYNMGKYIPYATSTFEYSSITFNCFSTLHCDDALSLNLFIASEMMFLMSVSVCRNCSNLSYFFKECDRFRLFFF